MSCLSALCIGAMVIFSSHHCLGQYTFLTTTGNNGENDTLRLFKITTGDSLIELDSLETIDDLNIYTHIDPRGNWVYVPFSSGSGEAQLFVIGEDNAIQLGDTQEGYNYSSSRAARRPDGAGVVNSESLETVGWYRYFYVTEDYHLMAMGASYELSDERIYQVAISQQGNFTVFAQSQEEYRTYHLDPNGDISPPSPSVSWGHYFYYSAQSLGISRDGHLIISAGGNSGLPGARNAVSLWIDDSGQVTEVDSIPYSESDLLCGGNVRSVCISNRSDWVLFHGNWTEGWELNPDGTFGDRIFRTLETQFHGYAALSADDHCAVVYHNYPERALSILRFGDRGQLLTITRQLVPYFAEGLNFVTRRRPGDANGDGWIDIADLVTLMNHLRLGIEIGNPVDFDHADVDRDGDRDDDDLDMLVGLLLGDQP